MKRLKLTLLIAIMLLGAGITTGCTDEMEDLIVGTWAFDNNPTTTLTFNDDNSGFCVTLENGVEYVDNFTYALSRSFLTILWEDEDITAMQVTDINSKHMTLRDNADGSLVTLTRQ